MVNALRLHLNKRKSGLFGPTGSYILDWFAGSGLKRFPKIGGCGVRILVLRHVGSNPGTKGLFTQIVLEHSNKGLPFLVRDFIESAVRLSLVSNRLLNRVACLASIKSHRPLFVVVRMHPNLPIWIEVIGRLFFHPARESLIEPNVVPPSHCDQIAKPLMGDLVGHYRENTLLCEV